MRPHVTLSIAMSIDGKIASPSRKYVQISDESDTKSVDKLRSEVDAIIVGESALKNDNPSLVLKHKEHQTARIKKQLPSNPIKIGITKDANLSVKQNFFTKGKAKKILFTTNRAKKADIESLQQNAEVIVHDSKRVDINKMLKYLSDIGIKKVLLEGGGSINGQFLAINAIDKIRLAIGPTFIGGEAPTPCDYKLLNPAPLFTLKSAKKQNNMAILTYTK